MKIKACSLVFSSPLAPDKFPGLGAARPRFLLPFAGRFTYLDMFLSPLIRAGVRKHLIVTQNFAEFTHDYMMGAWGDGAWQVLPFIPEEGDEPFDSQMYSLFKEELSPYVFFTQLDHPCWFDSTALASEFRMRVSSVQPIFGKRTAGLILTERTQLLSILNDMVRKSIPASQALSRAFLVLSETSGLRHAAVEGFHTTIDTLGQYIAANRAILDQQEKFRQLFAKVPLQTGLSPRAQAVIAPSAEFYRSTLADACHVRGRIYDSVLFPGVEIGKNTEIRDAVIFPGVKIGDNARISRCLVDSPLGLSQEIKLHIADGVRIGNIQSKADNRDHEKALGNGYSFVGSGTVIPRGVNIGGGCYIAPGLSRTSFSQAKNISDGRSITR
jgi:ADP-glucose pyrophosphorylase